jgi:hypothetical protein
MWSKECVLPVRMPEQVEHQHVVDASSIVVAVPRHFAVCLSWLAFTFFQWGQTPHYYTTVRST